MKSIWTENSKIPQFESLDGDMSVDVLVVGGGLTGVLCAKTLDDAGVNYALIEADRICGGVTKNTTAKITIQHGLTCYEFIKKFGVEKARLYFDAQNEALGKYRNVCRGIDCDFEEKDAFVYSIDNLGKIENELRAYEKIGVKAHFTKDVPLPIKTVGAVKLTRQAQFDPLKFVSAVCQGLNIFEQTKALEFSPDGVLTNRGKIRAKKIIMATHFPIINKHGWYFLKMYQHRSYVLALSGAEDVRGMYIDCEEKGLSFRNYGEYLLLGGGSHRTGKQGGGYNELEAFAQKHYPNAKITHRWATQDCMTLDGMPYIGQYSCGTNNLFVATGFNKWGMTNAMLSAMMLADMVTGKENKYADVFSPSRSILRGQLFCNLGQALLGWVTPTAPRCPHLGCVLKYNRAEHTWDCPCHGSRFTDDGQLIDNPATDDKKM